MYLPRGPLSQAGAKNNGLKRISLTFFQGPRFLLLQHFFFLKRRWMKSPTQQDPPGPRSQLIPNPPLSNIPSSNDLVSRIEQKVRLEAGKN